MDISQTQSYITGIMTPLIYKTAAAISYNNRFTNSLFHFHSFIHTSSELALLHNKQHKPIIPSLLNTLQKTESMAAPHQKIQTYFA